MPLSPSQGSCSSPRASVASSSFNEVFADQLSKSTAAIAASVNSGSGDSIYLGLTDDQGGGTGGFLPGNRSVRGLSKHKPDKFALITQGGSPVETRVLEFSDHVTTREIPSAGEGELFVNIIAIDGAVLRWTTTGSGQIVMIARKNGSGELRSQAYLPGFDLTDRSPPGAIPPADACTASHARMRPGSSLSPSINLGDRRAPIPVGAPVRVLSLPPAVRTRQRRGLAEHVFSRVSSLASLLLSVMETGRLPTAWRELSMRRVLIACALSLTGCAATMPLAAPAHGGAHRPATQAADALRNGSFDEASRQSEALLASDPANPQARLVRAIVRYRSTMHQLSLDARTVFIGGLESGGLNHRYVRSTLEQAEQDLAAVDADLASATADPTIALEFCPACWEIDWNGNGRIDRRDRLLMQIEQDADGKPIPEDDPRRKPTYRFDAGDVLWARAFVTFQRAGIDLLLAWDWSAVDPLLQRRGPKPDRIVIKLAHRDRFDRARDLLLQGLEHSDASRRAYLAETDDDREWVPNPRQQSHPMPLPVDAALYETWEGVVRDLRALARGDEGLDLGQIAALDDDHHLRRAPMGYLDLGSMLSRPKDIVIDLDTLERAERSEDADALLRSVLGSYYVRSMKRSPLPARLARMKGEVDRHQEPFERKLRYLIWLN